MFNRLTNLQQGITSRGLVPTMYANPSGPVTIGSDNIAFPGYNPFTPGNGGAFGGPQNLLQFYEDLSYTGARIRSASAVLTTISATTALTPRIRQRWISCQEPALGPGAKRIMAGQFTNQGSNRSAREISLRGAIRHQLPRQRCR